VSRILVVAPNWIGDALMAQPLLARLREQRPDIKVDMLAPAWVAPVARRMPEVDEVITTPFRHGALNLRRRWQLGRTLKERRYRQAIVLPNSWKAALVPFFADIPLRSGYVGESRYGLLNLLYRRGDRAMREHYARLAEAPGTEPATPLPQARLRIDAAQAAATRARYGLQSGVQRGYAVLCPGAEYGPAKRWPYFAELSSRVNLPLVILGSAGDRAAAASLAGRNLIGQTSLDEAIELISCAEFVVTNDSGLMHVAAAVGTPQVALFGSSSPKHTPPLSSRARVLWLGIECSPCYARECPLGHFRCMRELTVDRVLDEIASMKTTS
jgi:heptosyltransferase-2